jgi:hypothetical protein
LLRQQLQIVKQKQERGPQIPRWQKVPLAMLAVRLKEQARNGKAALEDWCAIVQASYCCRLVLGDCATEMDLQAMKVADFQPGCGLSGKTVIKQIIVMKIWHNIFLYL